MNEWEVVLAAKPTIDENHLMRGLLRRLVRAASPVYRDTDGWVVLDAALLINDGEWALLERLQNGE